MCKGHRVGHEAVGHGQVVATRIGGGEDGVCRGHRRPAFCRGQRCSGPGLLLIVDDVEVVERRRAVGEAHHFLG